MFATTNNDCLNEWKVRKRRRKTMPMTTGTIQQQPARGPLLILELAAIGDRVSRGQTDFPADSILNLTHKAAEVTSTHVRHDYHTPLTFFAIDYLSGAGDAYVSNLAKGHLLPARSVEQDIAHCLRIPPVARRKP
jgi:hypothetical protein